MSHPGRGSCCSFCPANVLFALPRWHFTARPISSSETNKVLESRTTVLLFAFHSRSPESTLADLEWFREITPCGHSVTRLHTAHLFQGSVSVALHCMPPSQRPLCQHYSKVHCGVDLYRRHIEWLFFFPVCLYGFTVFDIPSDQHRYSTLHTRYRDLQRIRVFVAAAGFWFESLKWRLLRRSIENWAELNRWMML